MICKRQRNKPATGNPAPDFTEWNAIGKRFAGWRARQYERTIPISRGKSADPVAPMEDRGSRMRRDQIVPATVMKRVDGMELLHGVRRLRASNKIVRIAWDECTLADHLIRGDLFIWSEARFGKSLAAEVCSQRPEANQVRSHRTTACVLEIWPRSRQFLRGSSNSLRHRLQLRIPNPYEDHAGSEEDHGVSGNYRCNSGDHRWSSGNGHRQTRNLCRSI